MINSSSIKGTNHGRTKSQLYWKNTALARAPGMPPPQNRDCLATLPAELLVKVIAEVLISSYVNITQISLILLILELFAEPLK
jgi:hypothetical protein